MKIRNIEIDGFRGFSQKVHIDLDADAVIVVGANGQCKTSLFDAILWTLTGRVPRLGNDDHQLVSMYSSSGEVRVAIDLQGPNSESYRVIRSYNGGQQRLTFEQDHGVLREDEARFQLLRKLWPEALTAPDSTAALTSAVTRSVYLQQDLVRQFIDADTEQERFTAVSELVGAGRVTELQLQLDRARTAWTRATNARAKEGEGLRQRLTLLESQLARLERSSADEGQDLKQSWVLWWAKTSDLGLNTVSAPEIYTSDAASALDSAIKQLDTVRRANERRRDMARDLLTEVGESSEPSLSNVELYRAQRDETLGAVERARGALAEAESRAAHARRAQVEIREAHEELRTFAKLSLRHLGDRCPVCQQYYDFDATHQRLQKIAEDIDTDALSIYNDDDVRLAASTLENHENVLAALEAKVREAEHLERAFRSKMTDRNSRLNELGLSANAQSTVIEELVAGLGGMISSIMKHQREGEKLALRMARAVEQARRAELEREIPPVRLDVESLDRDLGSRMKTGDLADQILEALRQATSDVVDARLARIEPILQRIYARIDPHPSLRVVRILSRMVRGRGHMITLLEDPLHDLSTDAPSLVLSSSQMNALAVAVFLALNLGVPGIPLSTAILDDPLQSLDDINLLGLLDLLRRTKERRQLMISTHDARFGDLLMRKLRPISANQRTCMIELSSWSRRGPEVQQRDVRGDAVAFRLAV